MLRFAVLALALALPMAAQNAPFSVNALLNLQRVSDPQVSPDGLWVAFVVSSYDTQDNSKSEQIFTVPILGGTPRRLTWEGSTNVRPRWSPDSGTIAFLSNRNGGHMQVWTMQADGGAPRQVTDLPMDASAVLYSPDGTSLIFTAEVFPDCFNMACNRQRLESVGDDGPEVRSYDELMFRHWNQWSDGRKSHIFAVRVTGGEPMDLTPGALNAPPLAVGGPDNYDVSPDGKELVYVVKPDPNPASSTNTELYVTPIKWDSTEPRPAPTRLTTNPAGDIGPSYSPDGNHIAWLSQQREGYESDRWRLTVMERKPIEYPDDQPGEVVDPATGMVSPADSFQGPVDPALEDRPVWEWDTESTTVITEGLDRPVMEFTWSPDSTRLFFTTEDRGRRAIQMIAATGGQVTIAVTGASTLGSPQFTRDGGTMVYTEQTGSKPADIFAAYANGGVPTQLTNFNQNSLNRYMLNDYEEFFVDSQDQTPVHSFLLKPPNFSVDERYPVLFLIHGGPQGAWEQSWSYRWNAQVFAAAGYVVVMPNLRGSIGYGQRFTDEINGDWGGRPFQDLMAVVNHVSSLPYVMPDRMAAAGGSYGGYMIDWMMGHTQRFRALVSHAGVFDLASWAMETEELWFPMWEFHGMPWEQPDLYAQWSPDRFTSDFFTPTLITAGERDYRVPYGQSVQLFTALRKQNVDAKLLVFPGEGHWIQKPKNSQRWYNEVISWLDYYVKPSPSMPATLPAAPDESDRPNSPYFGPQSDGLTQPGPTAPPEGTTGLPQPQSAEPPNNDQQSPQPAEQQQPPEPLKPTVTIP